MFEDKDLEKTNDNFELDLSENVYDATRPAVRNVNSNRRTVNATLPREEDKASVDWKKTLKWVIIAVVLIFAIDFAKGLIPGSVSLDHVVNMNTEAVEKELGLTFARNCSMKNSINHYSEGEVTVDGDGEIGVVYIDGVHIGLHVDSKAYSLFGVKIGDSTSTAEQNMTFQFDNYMSVINDKATGVSTALFYYNEANNDCLVVIYNDMTHRAVALTYFNDYRKVTETLSSI